MSGNDVYFRFKIEGSRKLVTRAQKKISGLGDVSEESTVSEGFPGFRKYTYQGLLLAHDPQEYDSIIENTFETSNCYRTRVCFYGFSLERSILFPSIDEATFEARSMIYKQIAPIVDKFSPGSVNEVASGETEQLLHKVFGSIRGPIFDVIAFRDCLTAISKYELLSTFKYLPLDAE